LPAQRYSDDKRRINSSSSLFVNNIGIIKAYTYNHDGILTQHINRAAFIDSLRRKATQSIEYVFDAADVTDAMAKAQR